MATLDQLPPDKRAIIELVVRRGQSYDDIARQLDMPPSRVREYAREALVSLAPRTADRVDPSWRDQLADYVLGQQSGPESTATRGHLKRSEPARAWALSVLDSLGGLYSNGSEPEIPEPEATARPRGRRRGGSSRPAADRGGTGKVADEPAAATPAAPAAAARDDRDGRGAPPLSPEARAVVRRRRVLGALAGVAGLVALALLAMLIFDFGLFGGDDDPETAAGPADPAAEEPQVLSQLELEPVGDARGGAGLAIIAQQGDQRQLVVQARLPRTRRNEAYEVWLYNSREDAQSVGAQVTDRDGNYIGAGPIPADYERFEFIDISRETTDQDPAHSGESVLRGRIAEGQPPEQGGATPGEAPPAPGGTPTAPAPGNGTP